MSLKYMAPEKRDRTLKFLNLVNAKNYEATARMMGGSGSGASLLTIDLPDDVLAEIKRRYVAAEISQADISDEYGINRSRVCIYCKQQGWTAERNKINSLKYAKAATEVASLIRQGLTDKRILEQGYTPGNIKAARRLYKLKGTRGRKEKC